MENAAAGDWKLTEEIKAEIDAAFGDYYAGER